MFKAVSRVLIITMMFVAFIGQAIAFNTAMYCETSVAPISANIKLVKHLDSNTVDTNSSEDCCDIECCNVNCICIANACSSYAYFNTIAAPTRATVSSDVIYIQQSEQPKSISTLLYRPPIFTL